MGYRSEVAIKCEDKAYEMFMNALKNVDAEPDEIFKYEEDGITEYLLKWNWAEYEDVKAVTGVMDALDEYDESEYAGCRLADLVQYLAIFAVRYG